MIICKFIKKVYNIFEGDFMRNFKFNVKLISLVMTGVILITSCSNQNKNDNEQSLTNTVETEQKIPNIDSSNVEISKPDTNTEKEPSKNENTSTSNETTNKEQKPSDTTEPQTIPTTEQIIEINEKDSVVLEEIKNLKSDIKEILNSDTAKDIKETCKNVFITLVDFIFYDGDIKGITFDELSDAAKQEFLKEVDEIDNLIMKKFPNYKEEISSKTSSAYNKAKDLIKKGANNIKDFAKDKLGDENYNAIKEFKDEFKQSASVVWEDLKDDISNVYGKIKEKIKNWYENFRN